MTTITVYVRYEGGYVELDRYEGAAPRRNEEIALMKYTPTRVVRVGRVRRGVHPLGKETCVEVWCAPVDMQGKCIQRNELEGAWRCYYDKFSEQFISK